MKILAVILLVLAALAPLMTARAQEEPYPPTWSCSPAALNLVPRYEFMIVCNPNCTKWIDGRRLGFGWKPKWARHDCPRGAADCWHQWEPGTHRANIPTFICPESDLRNDCDMGGSETKEECEARAAIFGLECVWRGPCHNNDSGQCRTEAQEHSGAMCHPPEAQEEDDDGPMMASPSPRSGFDNKEKALVAGGAMLLGAGLLAVSGGGIVDAFAFRPLAAYEVGDDGESLRYGGRLEYREGAWALWWEAEESDGDARLGYGGEWRGDVLRASAGAEVWGEDDVALRAMVEGEWLRAGWRIRPAVRGDVLREVRTGEFRVRVERVFGPGR